MTIDKCLEILNKISTPLAFAARDDYRCLPFIRDMGKSLKYLSEKLAYEISLISLPEDRAKGVCPFAGLKEFEAILSGFDQASPEERRKAVARSFRIIQEIEVSVLSAFSEGRDAKAGRKATLMEMDKALTCFQKLALPVLSVKGVGPGTARLLERKGLTTIEDLMYFLPRRYEDRRHPLKISHLRAGMRETVTGTVSYSQVKFYGKRPVFEAIIEDETGSLKAKWFRGNPAYLKRIFKKGNRVILTGETGVYSLQMEMIHPDFETLDKESDNLLNFGRIVPVYSETEGLYQKNLRRIMKQALDDYAACVLSPIPEAVCKRNDLMDIGDAVMQAHFPAPDQNVEDYNAGLTAAHKRLIFDELFFFQLGLLMKKNGQSLEKGITFKTGGKKLQHFYKMLPFTLTSAQRRVIGELERDMAGSCAMNRLIQGDVGCGKTVVAMAAMATACDNGCQAALMAPTEILAEQHYGNIKHWSEEIGFKVVLLTGKKSAADKRNVCEQIRSGKANIVVGTHALIQEEVTFHRLGLAIIDEQHRFGVAQRAAIRDKGVNPHILVMTATPIPRTLAMTVYGDLDVSVVDEMPPGRQPIPTRVFHEQQRGRVYEIIDREIKKGRQVFIVYPLVEESEHLDMKDATGMAEHLQREVFPEYCVGLVHGRLKRGKKEEIMAAFGEKKLHILVSTTVIEVGLDIPEASLMVIEHAERFGLSQLHQLRGRVGRSDIPSACILLAYGSGSEDSRKRLRIMEKTNDGFLIAEEDLCLRGPGEFMGTRQSGLPDFRIANLMRDGKLLMEAKLSASSVLKDDPLLEKREHALLKSTLLRRWEERLQLARI